MSVGSHIGQYRIVRKLGAGGMGAVFLGEHILLGRRAAIKTLLPALSANREIVERFFTEARATSAITDPGVVQVFDFGYHVDGTAYIVMELLEGEELSARIDRLGQLPVSEALRITRQVASSLAAAHERGIVHRDLKPENIFLIHDAEAQGGERTKILDFGICMGGETQTTGRITHSGAMIGTPVYMSPEQCRGTDDVDHRSDIYALGCVLFHMLTGRAPFEHDAPGDFIVSHMREEAPAPSTFVPELPPLVDELLQRCLAKTPEDRFQSMAALQAAIEYVLGHISAPGTSTVQARPALLLGAGFKSVYDANRGTSVPSADLAARIRQTPVTGAVQAPRPWRRAMIALVVLVLVAGAGLIATRVTIGGVDAVAQPSYRYTSPVEQVVTPPPAAPLPSPPPPLEAVAPVETAPVEPAAPVEAAVPAPAAEPDELASPFPELAPSEVPPVEAKPASKPKLKTRRRTPARQPPKSPPASAPTTEDLYDTR